MIWQTTPPVAPRMYRWRLSCKWEPVERAAMDMDGELVTYSHRFQQYVPLHKVEGEWLY